MITVEKRRPGRPRRHSSVHDFIPVRALDVPFVVQLQQEHPRWRPVPLGSREVMFAFCERCDRLVLLRFGPGNELCPPCRDGETSDLIGARQ